MSRELIEDKPRFRLVEAKEFDPDAAPHREEWLRVSVKRRVKVKKADVKRKGER